MNPTLIEPGTKYFLNQTLRKCKEHKYKFYSLLFNLGLLIAFICIFVGILIYKYKGKPSKEYLQQQKLDCEKYILSKIKIHKKPEQKLITNLPSFDNNTEIMHRNFLNN